MGCPDAGECPVVDPGIPRHLRSHTIPASTSLYSVSRHDSVFNRSGVGDSRFSPLFGADGTAIPHVYLAQNQLGALLESALHSTWNTSTRVKRSTLGGLSMRIVTCRNELRVADIRNTELKRHGIMRNQLVASAPEHYRCTRIWAQPRAPLSIGGRTATGFIWNSRQAELAATNAMAPMSALLTGADQTTEVVVIYDHDDVGDSPFTTQTLYEDLSTGAGLNFVMEAASIMGLFVDD